MTTAAPSVERVDLSVLGVPERAHVGSVQTMYDLEIDGGEYLLMEAPDRGSVFDVGTVFEIPGSGRQRQTLRHRIFTRLMDPAAWRALGEAELGKCFSDAARVRSLLGSATFERLCAEGARTGHVGLVDRETGEVVRGETDLWSDLVLMDRYPVVKPERVTIEGTPVYDYSRYFGAPRRIIALEHIVRLGNPGGSSLQSRYDRLARASAEQAEAFLAPFGMTGPLAAWSRLPNAAVEWSTKYEGYDRYLSRQEALLVAGVDAAKFNELVELLLLCTVQVHAFVSRTDLELWDLKWEVALDRGTVVVVDTMDHDSMRLTLRLAHEEVGPCVVHFNKQAVRDYFKIFHPEWHRALGEAKRRSDLQGSDAFKDVYWRGVESGEYPAPPELDAVFADLQSRKYACVTDGPEVDEDLSYRLAEEEVGYYVDRGRKDDFCLLNSVPTA